MLQYEALFAQTCSQQHKAGVSPVRSLVPVTIEGQLPSEKMASYGKGKSIEYNGPWSQWFWDDGGNGQGFWYRSRLKANGEQELDFNNDPNNPSYGPLGKSVPRNADNLDITTSSSSLEAQNGLSSSEHDSAYTTRPPYFFDSQMSRTDYTYPPATSKTATSELQSHSQDRRAQTSRYAPNPSYSPQGNTSMRSPTSGQEQGRSDPGRFDEASILC